VLEVLKGRKLGNWGDRETLEGKKRRAQGGRTPIRPEMGYSGSARTSGWAARTAEKKEGKKVGERESEQKRLNILKHTWEVQKKARRAS